MVSQRVGRRVDILRDFARDLFGGDIHQDLSAFWQRLAA
jgi:hypothetical protein